MTKNRISKNTELRDPQTVAGLTSIGALFDLAQTHSFGFRVRRLLRVRARMAFLAARNRISKKMVTGTAKCDVSLTTHGHRIKLVHHSIESIGRGSARPHRIVLWVDDPDLFNNLPATLVRLQKRGLEIKLTANYGPHTKYYPYVVGRRDAIDVPLVTADDDIIYPRRWLQGLLESHRRDPKSVWCYRAHRLSFSRKQLLPYSDWTRATSDIPSYRHFATGVSGVIYPPLLLDALGRAGEAFKRAAPRADDIWLHAMAVRSGYRVRQIRNESADFDIVRGTWAGGLVGDNTTGGNDEQIGRTYTQDDIERILADSV